MRDTLLTGATGTIGSALVPRLLDDEAATVTLLIRAPDDAALQERLARMLLHWNLEPDSPRSKRLRAFRGDITLPDFGLTGDTWKRLPHEITHIVHCAASVRLNMTMDQALATAVQPTRTVLALARQCATHGKLQKIDLVSTVGVWGRTPGRMPERRLPEVRQFHNTYEAAKAEAERVVWAEGGNLPITLHRPSMVVGETGTGRVIHFQIFYHLCEFLSGVRTFGVMPDLGDTRLDTVPVDWVADVICWASHHDETAGRIFHLCSGPVDAIRLIDLQSAVRLAWQASGRRLPRLWQVDRRWLERLIPVLGVLAGSKGRRALRGLSPVLAYLAEDQGFDNPGTAACMAVAGLPIPRVQDYLAPVLAYYLNQRSPRATP